MTSTRARRIGLHVVRNLIFLAIVGLIATQPAPEQQIDLELDDEDFPAEQVQELFPEFASFGKQNPETRSVEILDQDGESIGYLVQTMPDCQDIIGFSGPSNLLIGFGNDDAVVGITILGSKDTREHVTEVEQANFLNRTFTGVTWSEISTSPRVDGVSGATLTSLAMWNSVRLRIDGDAPITSRFDQTITVERVREILPNAGSITNSDDNTRSAFDVTDEGGQRIGWLLRTSPSADHLTGYQGPTETYVVFSLDDVVLGLIVDDSFDNEPYVSYLREDEYGFLLDFNGQTLSELAGKSAESEGIEGVSGATMTSVTAADAIFLTARTWMESREAKADQPARQNTPQYSIDVGMILVVVVSMVIGMTRLRGYRPIRWSWLLLLIGYLGWYRGDMLSQAMLAGWAESGLPVETASGLVLLTAVAFAIPMLSKRNLYCTHLCPHGAVQQLVANRLPWQWKLGRRLRTFLPIIPLILLGVVILVAFKALSTPLVAIEAFDAWHFRIAGIATISIAVIGLLLSLFVPMAYCKFGCPTGLLLRFLRYHARSDRWTVRDWAATGLLLLALTLRFSS